MLSSGSMGSRRCPIMAPLSISWLSRNVVIPVSVSPFMIAWLMGAAPRYCGSREACRLNVPRRGMAQMISGSMRNAMTMPRSGFKALTASTNSSALSFSGCSIGSPNSRAATFTSLSCILRPRPAGLSGVVTTATTLYPSPARRRSDATANSGVPMNIMRKSFPVIII